MGLPDIAEHHPAGAATGCVRPPLPPPPAARPRTVTPAGVAAPRVARPPRRV